jgi:hypothetical protein
MKMTTHSQDCEKDSKELMEKCYASAGQHQQAMQMSLAESGGRPTVESLVLGVNVLTYMIQAEKLNSHIMEHHVDKLQADVLELQLGTEELVKQVVKNYFDPRLDNENL